MWFKFDNLLSTLSDKALSNCVALLHDLLDFKYIEDGDIRRIDLAERAYDLTCKLLGSVDNSIEEYLDILKFYFDTYLPCQNNSIASMYKKRAYELIQDQKNGDTEYQKTEDTFAIYLFLARSHFPYMDQDKYVTTNGDIFVSEEDAELLVKLRMRDYKEPITGFMKKTKIQEKKKKDIAFLYNVILYNKLMDAQGQYEEEVQ